MPYVRDLASGVHISQTGMTNIDSMLKIMTKPQLVAVSKWVGGPDLSGYWLKASANRDLMNYLTSLNAVNASNPAPSPAAPPPVSPSASPPTTAKTGVPLSTKEESWETGKPRPGSLHGVDFAPAPPKFWEKVKDVDIGEPPTHPGKRVDRCGIMVQEPDGRIWIVHVTNEHAGRKYTMPGGGVEPGLTDQQNALKEFWEETGLQVEITGFAGDFEDSNNKNNGRLYIGKRIGGAPWDAKIESKIIDHKTGKPAAESDSVHLVPPEVAAKMLHRTDDLAQLIVVHPIDIKQPTTGKGSEPLKKFIKAIEPARQAYENDKKAKRRDTGNGYLNAVQHLRGFNNKPQVVSKKDMDDLVKQGNHVELLRGVKDVGRVSATTLAEEFKRGDHYPGYGIFGSGTYADSNKGSSNSAIGQYSNYGSGAVIRMALPKDAKIIKISDLEAAVPKMPKEFSGYSANGSGSQLECWLGVQAALAGYDAIEVDNKYRQRHNGYGNGFHIILNRSKLVVQEEDAAGHHIK